MAICLFEEYYFLIIEWRIFVEDPTNIICTKSQNINSCSFRVQKLKKKEKKGIWKKTQILFTWPIMGCISVGKEYIEFQQIRNKNSPSMPCVMCHVCILPTLMKWGIVIDDFTCRVHHLYYAYKINGNNIFPWRPCFLSDRDEMSNFVREPCTHFSHSETRLANVGHVFAGSRWYGGF